MKSILGIGNALTDILAVLPDDSLLKTYHLPKGSMQHVDMETGDMIWAALRKYRENKYEIDTYDVVTAAQWLYDNIPDERFRAAMQFQIDFFRH